MTEIKLTKRYPQSRTEDIVDAYMRGWNDALDAVQNGKFIINDDRKTENSSEKPNNCEDEPQTDPLPKAINGVNISDAVAWADKWLEDNPVSEMWDMIRTLRDATEWQDEPQTNADQHTQSVENVGNTDCAWSEPNE